MSKKEFINIISQVAILLLVMLMLTGTTLAHNLEPLHVDGRYLKNPAGDIVTMHGYITDWLPYDDYFPEATNKMEQDFLRWKRNTDAILERGWKVDYVRFHFLNNQTTPDDFDGFVRDNLFERYYLPRIDYLNSKGIYVMLMCDCAFEVMETGYRYVGEKLWQLLMKYWDYVSSHPRIKNNPGVMFELANEPYNFLGSDGSVNDFRTLKSYYQPMVDLIRKNGCQQVIYVPGWSWDGYYAGYATFPIEGANIGYVVHTGPSHYNPAADNQWHLDLKVVSNMSPIIVSETAVDGFCGAYSYDYVYPENPTLASVHGKYWKRVVDEVGNVSWNILSEGWAMALTGQPSEEPAIYNDPEGMYVAYRDWYNDYAKTKITKVSSLIAKKVDLEQVHHTVYPGDVRPITLMATFSDGRRWNVAGDAEWTSSNESVLSVLHGNLYVKGEGTALVSGKYTDSSGKIFNCQFDVKSQLFPLTADGILLRAGTYDETTQSLLTAGWFLWDYGGELFSNLGYSDYPWLNWNHRGGLDFSPYKYLVVRMNKPATEYATFGIYDQIGSISDREPKMVEVLSFKSELVIDLHGYPNLDPSHITSIEIGSQGPISFKEIFLSNDGVNPALPFVVTPTVKANDMAMYYGDEVPELNYTVSGFGNVGNPKVTTTATKTSSVGNYEITPAAGDGADNNIRYLPGQMKVLRAPLNTVANDVEMYEGDDLPAFTITYSGLRNGDTESTAIIKAPTATTTATCHSPAGTYPIAVSGGQLNENYMLSNRQAGTLTILEPTIEGTDMTARVGTSPEDWHTQWTTSTPGVQDVTTKDGRHVHMAVMNKATNESPLELMWQEVDGLPNGDYLVELYANATYPSYLGSNTFIEDGAENVVYVEANGQRASVGVRFLDIVPWNGFYRINATVTDRKLRLSMKAEKPGSNYHMIQIKRLILLSTELPGDVNGDGLVNTSDVKAVADHIMGNTPANFIKEAADMNNDGLINAADIVKIVSVSGEKDILEKEWTGVKEFPYWFISEGTDATLKMVADGIAITNPHMQDQVWNPQTAVTDDCLTLEKSHNYIVRLTLKVPSTGTYQVQLGNWDTHFQCEVPVTASDDWQTIDVEFHELGGNVKGDGHVLLQNGWVVGTTIVKKVEVLEIVQ